MPSRLERNLRSVGHKSILEEGGAMKLWRFIGTGVLTIGTLAGAAGAAQPTKGDMDFCNQKAAQVSKATPMKPGAGTTPQPGSNPTGGRVTDSSQPGTSPSQLGMAPIGETEPAYRQAYLACINASPSQLGMAPIGETEPAYRQAYLACINERAK